MVDNTSKRRRIQGDQYNSINQRHIREWGQFMRIDSVL